MNTKFYKNHYLIPESAQYVVDYTTDNYFGEFNLYFRIVRLNDGAILYSDPEFNNVIMECWKRAIPFDDVAFI